MSNFVDIQKIKEASLKMQDPLKTLILSEPDTISKERYLEVTEYWLKILKIQKKETTKS